VWISTNYLAIQALRELHRFYGPWFRVACPTNSGAMESLNDVAGELSRRLLSLFVRNQDGRRPSMGAEPDPAAGDAILLYEYFDGENWPRPRRKPLHGLDGADHQHHQPILWRAGFIASPFCDLTARSKQWLFRANHANGFWADHCPFDVPRPIVRFGRCADFGSMFQIDPTWIPQPDGCNPARPVGFVEGWFVRLTQGLAR